MAWLVTRKHRSVLFFMSSGVVALAEMGDTTQLLAFILAARFRQPVPVIAGIFVATIFNHALPSAAGVWLLGVVHPKLLRWLLGLTFLGMMVWALIPDRLTALSLGASSAHWPRPGTARR